ncbi:MAG: acyl-CoA dehydrogenase family protein [Actinomycetota bacterium]|nr:acyl-CoA dehydrogenase family protein [Actinomycetota bacterium]
MDPFERGVDEFLVSSESALRSGADPLGRLGWEELLPEIEGDLDARRAVFSLLRAQGRQLVTTAAPGLLMALPYTPLLQVGAPLPVATIELCSPRRGRRFLVLGAPAGRPLLIDRSGLGPCLVAPADYGLAGVEMAGDAELHDVVVDEGALVPLVAEDDAAKYRARSRLLGRWALSCDILGAAEVALDLAVAYAGDRRQFGQPIGTFQSVRHLLAAARVDCAAIEGLLGYMVERYPDVPASYDKVVKAVAGRNGRRVSQHALQTLGGIGFITEHDFHRYQSRIVTLDALLGSSTRLAHQLAVESRRSGLTELLPAFP